MVALQGGNGKVLLVKVTAHKGMKGTHGKITVMTSATFGIGHFKKVEEEDKPTGSSHFLSVSLEMSFSYLEGMVR